MADTTENYPGGAHKLESRANHAGTVLAMVKRSEQRFAAASPIPNRFSESVMSANTADEIAAVSPLGTTNPVTPSSMISLTSPTSVATLASPQSPASMS